MYDVQLTTSYFPAQTDQVIRDITIGDALAEAVRDHSDRPALTEIGIDGATGRRWTYSEMAADAERLAFALASRFKKGERVVVWAPNIPEWALMEFACALSGVILVTANPAFQASELRYVLDQSQASALFLVAEYRGNPMGEIGAEAERGRVEGGGGAGDREQEEEEGGEGRGGEGAQGIAAEGFQGAEPARNQNEAGEEVDRSG